MQIHEPVDNRPVGRPTKIGDEPRPPSKPRILTISISTITNSSKPRSDAHTNGQCGLWTLTLILTFIGTTINDIIAMIYQRKRCMSTNGLPTAALASHGLRSMRNHERGTTVSDKYINMYRQTNALPMAKVVPTGLVGSYKPRIRQLPNNALTATTDALTHFPLLDNLPC